MRLCNIPPRWLAKEGQLRDTPHDAQKRRPYSYSRLLSANPRSVLLRVLFEGVLLGRPGVTSTCCRCFTSSLEALNGFRITLLAVRQRAVISQERSCDNHFWVNLAPPLLFVAASHPRSRTLETLSLHVGLLPKCCEFIVTLLRRPVCRNTIFFGRRCLWLPVVATSIIVAVLSWRQSWIKNLVATFLGRLVYGDDIDRKSVV